MPQNTAGWLTQWTPDRVAAAEDPCAAYAEYLQQTMGIPWPTIKDMSILRKHTKEFFDHYPNADWYTMCRLANYFRRRKRRFGRVYQVVTEFRDAYRDGALPELDPGYGSASDSQLELNIAEALAGETRPEWVERLIRAEGVEARRGAYELWLQSSSPSR